MAWKTLFLTLLMFSITALVHAQNFQLGFRVEPNLVKTEHNHEVRPYNGWTGIMLHATVFPIGGLGIEGRAGIVPFIDFYGGPEAALLLKYHYELNYRYFKSVYLTGGYVFHRIEENSNINTKNFQMNLSLPAIGIGINPFSSLNLEVLYLNGLDTENGFHNWGGSWDGIRVVRIKNVLKFGIGFSWNIFSWKY